MKIGINLNGPIVIKKFVWWPVQCSDTQQWIWLTIAHKITDSHWSNAKPEIKWRSKNAHLIRLLKGKK